MGGLYKREQTKAPFGVPGAAAQPCLDRIRFLFNASGLWAATGAAAADVLSLRATERGGRAREKLFSSPQTGSRS